MPIQNMQMPLQSSIQGYPSQMLPQQIGIPQKIG